MCMHRREGRLAHNSRLARSVKAPPDQNHRNRMNTICKFSHSERSSGILSDSGCGCSWGRNLLEYEISLKLEDVHSNSGQQITSRMKHIHKAGHKGPYLAPSKRVSMELLGHNMAAPAYPRQDMCQAPQQTAEINTSHYCNRTNLRKPRTLPPLRQARGGGGIISPP